MTSLPSRLWDAICEMQASDGGLTKAKFEQRAEEIIAADLRKIVDGAAEELVRVVYPPQFETFHVTGNYTTPVEATMQRVIWGAGGGSIPEQGWQSVTGIGGEKTADRPEAGDEFVGPHGLWRVVTTPMDRADREAGRIFVTLRNDETLTDERMSLDEFQQRRRYGTLIPRST